MLKGTTKIELTDVNTGETQVIEKHNAVTGALQELFNPVLGHLTTESRLTANLPAYASFLGGLLLFDGRIGGDPLPLYAPDSVKLVGCARYSAASTQGSIYQGSYDANESVFSTANKTAKFVYNFTQAQGNGTINSICLTHRNAGLGVYRGDTSLKNTGTTLAISLYAPPSNKLIRNSRDKTTGISGYTSNEFLYAIDIDNDTAYYFRLTAETTLVLVKRRIGLKNYSMFGNAAEIIGDPVTITLPKGISSSSVRTSYNFDPETNALYIISAMPSSTTSVLAINAQFTVTKVVLGEEFATQVTITNNHTAGVFMDCAYVYRGRVYTTTASTTVTINGKTAKRYTVVSYSLQGNSVATHGFVTSSSAGTDPVPMYAADGRLYWQGHYDTVQGIGGLQVTDCTATPDDTNTTLCGIDYIDLYTSSSTYYAPSCTPVLNHPMLTYLSIAELSNAQEGFYFLAHYLATVNNLSTPIVKAPTQTMKITYTIQEV